jgi:hypothetical protein
LGNRLMTRKGGGLGSWGAEWGRRKRGR